jgi:hypothetical protein
VAEVATLPFNEELRLPAPVMEFAKPQIDEGFAYLRA